MELKKFTSCFVFLMTVVSTFSIPISHAATSGISVTNHTFLTPSTSKCVPMEIPKCSTFYNAAQMPNVFGVYSQIKASETLKNVLAQVGATNKVVTSFLCTVLIPPCPSGSQFKVKTNLVPLPCRKTCDEALAQSRGSLSAEQTQNSWPVRCHGLPKDNCFAFDETSGIYYVKSGKPANTKKTTPRRTPEIARFAPLEVELGQEEDVSDDVDDLDDDEFKVEVVSLTSTKTPVRLFDIPELGDPEFFHGWADVQGDGAANDYCRVIGQGKKRFLSCNLAGNSRQDRHHYISKLGVDLGHAGTWFMQDMDGDGRDDYCRCVGTVSKSQVTCMKAGQRGFFGSSIQGGSEHTFTVPFTEHCVKKLTGQALTH